jgi:ferritin-like protein
MARQLTGLNDENLKLRATLEAKIQTIGNADLAAFRRTIHDRAFTMPDGKEKRTHQLLHLMLQHEIKVREMLAEMVDKA